MASPTITLDGDEHVAITVGDLPWSDPGASASDTEDGDISSDVTVIGKHPDAAGIFALAYNVQDSDGNNADTKIRTIRVTDTVSPDTYDLEWRPTGGATTAVNDLTTTSHDLTGLSIDTDYEFRVKGKTSDGDESSFASWTPYSTNTDTTPPVITLNGDANITLLLSEVSGWTDPGATAEDNVDGDITDQITKTGTVDEAIGTYTLDYDVTDSAGNAAETKTRTVEVVEETYPTLELTDGMLMEVSENTTWTDPGYTATESDGTDITSDVQVTGTVDTSTPGEYVIDYEVSNSIGLTTLSRRYVAVSDVIHPDGYDSIDVDVQETKDGYTNSSRQVNVPANSPTIAVNSNTSNTVKIRGEKSGVKSGWSGTTTFTVSYTPELAHSLFTSQDEGRFYGLEVTVDDVITEHEEDFVITGTCNSDKALIQVTVDGTTYETKAVNGVWEIPIRYPESGALITSNRDELIYPNKLLTSGAAQDTETDGFKVE